MIKLIIFDIGGVLVPQVENQWEKTFRQLENDFGCSAKLLHEYFSENLHLIQCGKWKLLDFYKNFSHQYGLSIGPEAVLETTLKQYMYFSSEMHKDLYNHICELKKIYRVVCYTNTEYEIAQYNKNRGLFDIFERVYISCDMRTRKPDKKGFIQILKDYNIKGEETLFIDDLQEYLNGAESVGIQTYLYSNFTDFKKYMSQK